MRTDLPLTRRQRLRLRSIVSGCTAINGLVKTELFPDELRALGVGLPAARAASA